MAFPWEAVIGGLGALKNLFGGGSRAPAPPPVQLGELVAPGWTPGPGSLPSLSTTYTAKGGEAEPRWNLDELLNRYLYSQISGQGGLPEASTAQSLATLNQALNAQAMRAREQVKSALGQRGLLDSGLYAKALSEIEAARTQNLAAGATSLLQSRIQSQLQAQQQAADLFARLKAARWQAELSGRAQGLDEARIAEEKRKAEWEVATELATMLGRLKATQSQPTLPAPAPTPYATSPLLPSWTGGPATGPPGPPALEGGLPTLSLERPPGGPWGQFWESLMP